MWYIEDSLSKGPFCLTRPGRNHTATEMGISPGFRFKVFFFYLEKFFLFFHEDSRDVHFVANDFLTFFRTTLNLVRMCRNFYFNPVFGDRVRNLNVPRKIGESRKKII